jgi:benzoyl-CoA reductase subunit D
VIAVFNSHQERLTAGIDAGSSSVKVAVLATRGDHVQELATAVQRIRRRDVREVVQSAYGEALTLAGVREADLDYVASTGDGDAVLRKTGHFYGMTAHARGALHLDPEARAVLDIGALHARAIQMDARGKVTQHRMTSQCASGSRQFVENISRYLGVPLEDVGALSASATQPEAVSSICAVLAETDVINMVSRSISAADILRGVHESIAGRLERLLRAIGAKGVVLVTGGLAVDFGLQMALRQAVRQSRRAAADLEVRAAERGILAGALGAALLSVRRCEQLERQGKLAQLKTSLEATA